MPEALRKTGIPALREAQWGSHICLFYGSKQDLLDANVSYVAAGLQAREFCIWAISDPIDEDEARAALAAGIPDFAGHATRGSVEFLPGYDWYLKGGVLDPKRVTFGWQEKLEGALTKGFEGMRVSGNAFWMEKNLWKDFREYETELDEAIIGRPMIVLCTYSLTAARAVDLLDVAHTHNFSIALRNGAWEFLETPELRQANREIRQLSNAMDVLSQLAGQDSLTKRERSVLAELLRGASSREVGRKLGISPRTVDFHRANILRKLEARNIADLVRIALGDHSEN